MSTDWSQTLSSAERHISRGKIAAAIEDYHKLVRWDPGDLITLNTLGDLYVRVGLCAEAKPIFSQVAQGYRLQGFTAKAIGLLKKLLRIDPTDLESAASLAECYLAHGLRRDAARQYAEVAQAYNRAGREDKALAAYQRLAEIEPSNTSLQMALGERWLREGLRQRAHASFMAAGDENSRRGNNEGALAAYLKAQTVQPDEHRTVAAIASTCTALGQADAAIQILRESLSRNSGDAQLLRVLGFTYLSAGRLDEASRTFKKLLTIDRSQYRNLLMVGQTFLANDDIERAVEQLDAIVDDLILDEKAQEALDFVHKVLVINQEHPASLRILARIYRRLGEDFNLAQALNALADSSLRRGKTNEANEALKELRELDPYEQRHRGALQSLVVTAPASPWAGYWAEESPWESVTSDGCSEDGVLELTEEWSRSSVGAPSERESAEELHLVTASSMREAFSHVRVRRAANFELVTAADRRRCTRVSVRVPLVVISDTGGWREFTETVDVSDQGLRIRLAHPMRPTTALRILFETAKLPESVARFSAINTSVIVRNCKQWPGEPNLVGVEFEFEPEKMSNL